ncbi:DUF2968 domain-containing protein [Xanthomonas massiliensis]|uniref:DUF2968 domain-containing protein n=1 Tax=Xanthomonas massiliensis TaxID=1720302 RepID=UPI003CCDF796
MQKSRSGILRSSTLLAVCTLGVMSYLPEYANAARRGVVAQDQENQAPAPASAAVDNNVDELRRLMGNNQLTELRTTYNGTYGASLLFNPDTLTYYVALFQENEFWRVIKTDTIDNAETVYKTFVDQTRDLAQVYIDTVRLQAGKRYTDKLVAMNEQRLRSLQQEVEQQRQQSMQVSTKIQQTRQEAASLSSDLRATNGQLDALTERIKALKAIQDNPELSLPSPQAAVPQSDTASGEATGTPTAAHP